MSEKPKTRESWRDNAKFGLVAVGCEIVSCPDAVIEELMHLLKKCTIPDQDEFGSFGHRACRRISWDRQRKHDMGAMANDGQ